MLLRCSGSSQYLLERYTQRTPFCSPLLPVSTNVDVTRSSSPVGQTVDHVGVRMEGDNDGLVGGEHAVELLVTESMRVVILGNESESVRENWDDQCVT
jgi:hypothetical protein